MGATDQARDPNGRWASFSVNPKTGPTPAQKAIAARVMFGANDPRAIAAARAVVAPHAGVKSVGTHKATS